MKSYKSLALKYIKYNIRRTILVILTISLAMSLIICVGTSIKNKDQHTLINVKKSFGDYDLRFNNLSSDEVNILLKQNDIKEKIVINQNFNDKLVYEDSENQINLLKANKENLSKFDLLDILEGTSPTNENEVMITSNVFPKDNKKLLNKDIIIKDLNGDKNLRVVGIFKWKDNMYPQSPCVLIEDNKNNIGNENSDIYLKLNEKLDKKDIGKDIGKLIKKQPIFNEALLQCTDDGITAKFDQTDKNMYIFVVIIILLASIIFVYNIFSITYYERIKHYGIVLSLGGSNKHILVLNLLETIIYLLISLPISIIISFVVLKIGVYVLGKIFLLPSIKLYLFKNIILLAFGLISLVVIFSILLASRKITKNKNIINFIKSDGQVYEDECKKRKGKLFFKLLGYEGELAYKNIRRSGRKFWSILISLSLSLMLYISFSYILRDFTVGIDNEIKLTRYNDFSGTIKAKDIDNNYYKKIENINGISKVIEHTNIETYGEVDKSLISEVVKNYFDKNNRKLTEKIGVNLQFFDDNNLEKLIKEVNKPIDIKDIQNGGVLVVSESLLSNGNSLEKTNLITCKKGDRLPIKFSEINENKTLNIVNTINPKYTNIYASNYTIVIVMHKKFEKAFDKLKNKENTIMVKFNNENNRELQKYNLEEIANKVNGEYIDADGKAKEAAVTFKTSKVFMYMLILIVSIIGIVNTITSIVISIILRKNEFDTIRSLGADENFLNKMLAYEGLIYGLLSIVVGGILGTILGYLFNLFCNQKFSTLFKFDYKNLLIGSVLILIVTILSAKITSKQLKN